MAFESVLKNVLAMHVDPISVFEFSISSVLLASKESMEKMAKRQWYKAIECTRWKGEESEPNTSFHLMMCDIREKRELRGHQVPQAVMEVQDTRDRKETVESQEIASVEIMERRETKDHEESVEPTDRQVHLRLLKMGR